MSDGDWTYQQDYRLNAGDLKANHLPQELEAYPYYPEGIHIPVSEVGTIIITETSELDVPSVEVGVYNYEMDGVDSASIDIPLDELEDTVLHLMIDIRHTDEWCFQARLQIEQWFDEGRG